MNDCITTTKQSTTKPCAYFLGYTVPHHVYILDTRWYILPVSVLYELSMGCQCHLSQYRYGSRVLNPDTMTQFSQNILNLYYSTGSCKLFWYTLICMFCQREAVSSSRARRPMLRRPAHNPLILQLTILLHSMTLADMSGIKTELSKFCRGCHLNSRFTALVTSTLLLVSTVVCVFWCWTVPIGRRQHGNRVCLLFDFEVDTVFSLLLPTKQWYKFPF